MNKIYAARRRRNQIAMGLSLAATLIGLGWLVLILGTLLWEGFSGLSVAVFTEMTPPPGSAGGLLNPPRGSDRHPHRHTGGNLHGGIRPL
jgi:phosphate transport system permease protein